MVSISRVSDKAQCNSVRPLSAVVLHGEDSQNIACATYHKVGKGYRLSLGQVMGADKLTQLFTDLNAQGQPKSNEHILLSESVLLDDHSSIIWYRKRFVNPIWFRVGNGVQHFNVEWPPLLYCVNKKHSSLKVFALGSNSRPTLSSRLYHAPLMNINSSGVLCQGTATLPVEIDASKLTECESSLTDSQFTHINHKNTLRNGASSPKLIDYWRKKENGGKPLRVKVSEMSPTGRLSQLLNVKGNRHA